MTRTPEAPISTVPAGSETGYSPHRRTALVLTGTGTAGAYHAGVLRALHEAGVKVDLVAGRGIGAVGALFAAVDGAAHLWERSGVWSASTRLRLYGWRRPLRAAFSILGLTLLTLLLPLVVVVLAAFVYPVAYLLRVVGLGDDVGLTDGFGLLVQQVFATEALPIWLPRVVVLALSFLFTGLVCTAVGAWFKHRPRRRSRGAFWWLLLGAPLDASVVRRWFSDGLWKLMRGATAIAQPGPEDLGRRYTRLLSENLGQPGFRELLIAAHDLDGRRDLVFGILSEPYRRRFFSRRAGSDRHLEALDLGGRAGRHGFDAVAAALSLPVATDPWLVHFATASGWRGETHRMCDRPDAVGRLLDEVSEAGAEQVVIVSGLPGPAGPHELATSRRDGRGLLGESLASLELAGLRDAVAGRSGLFKAVFEIRPVYNPLGPFDFAGCYDERSDRLWSLSELVECGYSDGHRQFVGPVVGASGERISPGSKSRSSST
tara:strand:- start:2921 stop:4384 length:1464 start_codon:yes stop_codon:yes gene_type:complete